MKNQFHWEVHLYELGKKSHTCSKCKNKDFSPAEKGVDIGLPTKLLMLGVNKAFETAILVYGDKDYLETVRFVKNLGLRVEIFSWKAALSPDLEKESSTAVVFLDDIKNEIEKSV